MKVTIQKSCVNNVVTIPQEIMSQRNLEVGDTLIVKLNQAGDIVFSPPKPPITLEALLAASPKGRLTLSEEDRAWVSSRPAGAEL